ncbi:hypothetical protein [Mycolicibacterium palauense]|uniref:hypothetical protein n=1 Tax=Mycolicibacterium palauense TaxID=2034511 RepID=UPI000BFF04A0|nr:hypothetical protein [Mycolicibacterium palauense]
MRRALFWALPVLTAAACASAVGHAEPEAPQADASCAGLPAGTMARTAADALVQCSGDRWQPFTGVYPSSDTWLSSGSEPESEPGSEQGPALVLHGQARRNPEMMAGTWVGVPQDPQGSCGATVSDVIAAGEMAPPKQLTADPGQSLTMTVSTQAATIELTGPCLWQRIS